MPEKKDMNRIREIIFGTIIESFEERFETLERQIATVKVEQKNFHKKMLKKNRKSVEASQHALKIFKAELKMHVESKLNGLNNVKISHQELSEIFIALSKELTEKDNTKSHAKQQ